MPTEQTLDTQPSQADAPDYKRIVDWLEGAEMIWLPLHVSPDGDSLGSCLAFARVLRQHGYDCEVVSPDPIPAMYAPLYNAEDVTIGQPN